MAAVVICVGVSLKGMMGVADSYETMEEARVRVNRLFWVRVGFAG